MTGRGSTRLTDLPLRSGDTLLVEATVGLDAGATVEASSARNLVEEAVGLDTGATVEAASARNCAPAVKKGKSEEVKPHAAGLVMRRRVVAANNSCLFNSLAYLLEGKRLDLSDQLRAIVASIILSQPDVYTEAVLEKVPADYCAWIMGEVMFME